jgi:hypothetical protein
MIFKLSVSVYILRFEATVSLQVYDESVFIPNMYFKRVRKDGDRIE